MHPERHSFEERTGEFSNRATKIHNKDSMPRSLLPKKAVLHEKHHQLKAPPPHSRLNVPAIADITRWYIFISTWNGISMLWDTGAKNADFTVTSDTSGS